MAPRSDVARSWKSLEGWLRSPALRVLLVAGVVAAVAGLRTYQTREVRLAMGLEPLTDEVFLFHFATWGAWALASAPILWLARRLVRHAGWLIFLLVQIPLSFAAGWADAELEPRLFETVYGTDARASRGRYDIGPRGSFGGGPGAGGGGGLGGGEGFRGSREEPRERPPNAQPTEPGARGGRRERDASAQGPERGERRERRGGSFDPGRRRPEAARFEMLRASRRMTFYWLILGLGAGASAFLRSREGERRAADLELRAAHLRAELAAAQVDSLHAQLHPHFLFNALHTVGGLIRAGEERSALESLAGLGLLLRTTLDQADAQELTVREELEVAERYLAIEAIRFGERLRTRVEAGADVQAARLPALLLLPLVENAVRYGVEPRPEGGSVTVRIERDGEQLAITVTDDGPGFPADVLDATEPALRRTERRHIGLSNTRERLRVLYEDEQSFRLENPAGGGARVAIEIPFRTGGTAERADA